MPKLNPNILSDPIGGISSQFGVPTCILGIGADLLGLLPGNVLAGMSAAILQGQLAARAAISNIFRDLFRNLGIIEYDLATGRWIFKADGSLWGMDGLFGGLLSALGALQEVMATIEAIGEALDEIKDCLDEFEEWLKGSDSKGVVKSEGELANSLGKVAIYKAQVAVATDFLERAGDFQAKIEKIFRDRQVDPSLIPDYDPSPGEEDPLFRLTFGPPQAKQGQFLLSVDGLYYNSQTRQYGDAESPTDVPTVSDIEELEFVPDSERWLLDHSPNLGGRGSSYSLKDLNEYVDSIFDLDNIDESKVMQEYYEADHMVQFIISQKNKRLVDINNNLAELPDAGYGTDSALYINFQQQIISEGAAFNDKVNKRKKQIEVAVKTPDLFGLSTIFAPGEIPINDFSYLSSVNIDVEVSKQKNLSFDHGEVSGVVLPLVPKYIHAQDSKQKVTITPLLVAEPGAGSIVDGEELETQAPTLSLVTGITTDDLIAVYNFTDLNFQQPSSEVFDTLNCNALGTENRAQMVAGSPEDLFQKGLGIPYFTGMVDLHKEDANYEFKGETLSTYPFELAGNGNYVRLPDTPEYRDLMYKQEGATISFWTYVPGLYQQEGGWWEAPGPSPYTTSAFDFKFGSTSGKWANAHYYRVLLGCENTGGKNTSIDASANLFNQNTDSVRGMVMGFSRDPKMYYDGSVVNPGTGEFEIREGYGYVVDKITAQTTTAGNKNPGYAKDTTGVWTVSAVGGYSLPAATLPLSGTFTATSNTNITYSLGKSDGYALPNGGSVVGLYTVSGPDFDSSTALSGQAKIWTNATRNHPNHTFNMGAASTVFFIAPTKSYNTSSVGFARSLDCNNDLGPFLKFVVSDTLSVSGVKLEDCADKFINIAIAFDPDDDKINFYINGVLIKEGTISSVFQKHEGEAPQLPSFVVPPDLTTSSFYYSSSTVDQKSGVSVFDEGPNNNTYFTPWMVGGGWTDGRPVTFDDGRNITGGFLDTGFGLISSYNGYVGSLKFYKKALNKDEVIKNYNHQKTFFENIDL